MCARNTNTHAHVHTRTHTHSLTHTRVQSPHFTQLLLYAHIRHAHMHTFPPSPTAPSLPPIPPTHTDPVRAEQDREFAEALAADQEKVLFFSFFYSVSCRTRVSVESRFWPFEPQCGVGFEGSLGSCCPASRHPCFKSSSSSRQAPPHPCHKTSSSSSSSCPASRSQGCHALCGALYHKSSSS
jgi:hypothetical protein